MSEQQPKEGITIDGIYTVTEKMLQRIELRDGVLLDELRSRPHPAPALTLYKTQVDEDGAVGKVAICLCDQCKVNGFLCEKSPRAPCNYPDKIVCPNAILCSECNVNDIAAEASRKAREDVLDKVIAWKRKHGYWFTIDKISGEKRYHFEPDMFEEFIQSLRSEQEKGGSG